MCRRLPVLGRVGYLPYGPVVDRTVSDWETVRDQVVQALHGVGRSHLRMLFVQPPEGAEDISRGLLARGFRPSSAGIAPPGSIRIDLSEDLTQIRSRFGRRLRSWPNRWQARGVTVSVGDESDLPLLTRLMTHSAQRQGFTPPSDAYVETLYRELAARGNAALFIGRVHGRPVAADLVTICGEMIRGRLERVRALWGGGPTERARPRSAGRSSNGARPTGCAGWTSGGCPPPHLTPCSTARTAGASCPPATSPSSPSAAHRSAIRRRWSLWYRPGCAWPTTWPGRRREAHGPCTGHRSRCAAGHEPRTDHRQ